MFTDARIRNQIDVPEETVVEIREKVFTRKRKHELLRKGSNYTEEAVVRINDELLNSAVGLIKVDTFEKLIVHISVKYPTMTVYEFFDEIKDVIGIRMVINCLALSLLQEMR